MGFSPNVYSGSSGTGGLVEIDAIDGASSLSVVARAECYIQVAMSPPSGALTAPTQSPAPASGKSTGWWHLFAGESRTMVFSEGGNVQSHKIFVAIWSVATGDVEVTAMTGTLTGALNPFQAPTAMTVDGTTLTTSGAGVVSVANTGIAAAQIANATITATQLASNAVTTAKINAGAVTEAKLDPATNNTLNARRTARYTYDFATNGGTIGTIPLTGAALPNHAVVLSAMLDVQTALTDGGGGASAALQCVAANDLQIATAIAGEPWEAIARELLTPQPQTDTSWLKTTNGTTVPAIVVSVANLTAGHFNLWLDYVVADS